MSLLIDIQQLVAERAYGNPAPKGSETELAVYVNQETYRQLNTEIEQANRLRARKSSWQAADIVGCPLHVVSTDGHPPFAVYVTGCRRIR